MINIKDQLIIKLTKDIKVIII